MDRYQMVPSLTVLLSVTSFTSTLSESVTQSDCTQLHGVDAPMRAGKLPYMSLETYALYMKNIG